MAPIDRLALTLGGQAGESRLRLVGCGPHTFHGETCEDLGYTYYCAKTYTYHMSSANCI